MQTPLSTILLCSTGIVSLPNDRRHSLTLASHVAKASFLVLGEAFGQRLAVLVGGVIGEPGILSAPRERDAARDKKNKRHGEVLYYSRILPRCAQEGRLADFALDVERLLVGLELRLGRRALVLGVALALLRCLGTLLSSQSGSLSRFVRCSQTYVAATHV